ncbi:unnamed protein product [Rangifer tarandus platyrhynchus]|uniref:Uncharacterized protein n=1 Tax=Rangifer tarandus platyrhynchus TaxID=3082113 RepID=A0ABN8YN40_RANTA|nr:unnamed protein product [Rangifer tarandus platyrhynchus]
MAARPGSPEPHVCIPQCVWCDDQLCSPASPFSVDGLVVIQAELSRPQTPPPQDRLQILCTPPPSHPISALLELVPPCLASFSDSPHKAGDSRLIPETGCRGEERGVGWEGAGTPG